MERIDSRRVSASTAKRARYTPRAGQIANAVYATAFLTDAIIVQRSVEMESRPLRVMGMLKVRASEHSDKSRLYPIDDQCICLSKMRVERPGILWGRPTQRNHQISQSEADTRGVLS